MDMSDTQLIRRPDCGASNRAPREPLRILIPLSGADSDASALHVAAEMAPRDAEFFLLHPRSGPDDERYPDFKRASEAERFERGIESERIFARANAILASRGLISAGQLVAQGDPEEIILRVANQMAAELIVLPAGAARRVIDHAACSVLVAERGRRGQAHKSLKEI
jgi:nucleotide-binding universal stress UspA family protein